MPTNQQIAEAIGELATLLDLLGEDKFRINAHSRAARAIEASVVELETIADDRAKLVAIDGIGSKMADKITELCATGTMKELAEARAKVPPGLLEILNVPGLGPKTVKAMWDAGITDVPKLKAAINDGSILKLPRMGEKAAAKIKESLAFAAASGGRTWLGKAAGVARVFVQRLAELKGVARVEPAGSLRRGKETIGDIDILVSMDDSPGKNKETVHQEGSPLIDGVVEAFCTVPGVVSVIARGAGKCSVRFALEAGMGRWSPPKDPEAGAGNEGSSEGSGALLATPKTEAGGPMIQVDLRILPKASFGSALMYFTGSKEHNVRLRERALAMNYTLNEWGLFPLDRKQESTPQDRGVKPIASASEEEVFAALGLPWIPPTAREDRGEFEVQGPWELIEVKDIKAELHAHTTASDGSMSITELANMAASRGFHTIAVTDHSQSSSIAGGLKPDRLKRHIAAVREANEASKHITILAGSEVDILADGTLDYSDAVLADLDVVVASPHAGLTQDTATATARLIKAVSHPLVHILGHPTGRLILRRPGLSPDMTLLIEAAKAHNTALEINAHWMRLDLRDTHVRAAVQAGCLISINCDDHERADFDNLVYGVLTAQRGWLRAEQCINTWSKGKLHKWLRKGRG